MDERVIIRACARDAPVFRLRAPIPSGFKETLVMATTGLLVAMPFDDPERSDSLYRLVGLHVAVHAHHAHILRCMRRFVRTCDCMDATYVLVLPSECWELGFPEFRGVAAFMSWYADGFGRAISERRRFFSDAMRVVEETKERALGYSAHVLSSDCNAEYELIAGMMWQGMRRFDSRYIGGMMLNADMDIDFAMRLCPDLIRVTIDGRSELALRVDVEYARWFGRTRAVFAVYRSASWALVYECVAGHLSNELGDGLVSDIQHVTMAAHVTRIQRCWRDYVRRRTAAVRIQRALRPWLDRPMTADGKLGIRLRVALGEAVADGLVTPT
jgi:hypothetical protein